MDFEYLSYSYRKYEQVLIIGKSFDTKRGKAHIIGMTKDDVAKLYIIEPYLYEEEEVKKRQRQRDILKRAESEISMYVNIESIKLGEHIFNVCSGQATSLRYAENDIEMLYVYFKMLEAGWNIPAWLKEMSWDDLQLVELELEAVDQLPVCDAGTDITFMHSNTCRKVILPKSKSVKLTIGKAGSFSFENAEGEKVKCYVNDVRLIDVWEDAKKRFEDPRYRELMTEEQLEDMKKTFYSTLEENCPKGKNYIGIEYECDNDITLQFYSKEFLNSYPQEYSGTASALTMLVRPDKKQGEHGLKLKGNVIQTPVGGDVKQISVELIFYMEQIDAWEEQI